MNPGRFILEARDLFRTVRDGDSEKAIIRGFSFNFERGEIYNIMGPSGSGKSSLLRMFNRLDEASDGQVLFEGAEYQSYHPCELRRRIGYMFQTPYLFPGSIRENLLYPDSGLSDTRLRELITGIKLDPNLLDTDTDNLSLGEKQRIALARLLAAGPSMVLLDEPTSALDPGNTLAIEELIRNIARRHELTVIMVTHNPEQAVRMGGEALLLYKGELAEWGGSDQVVNNPRTEIGRRYKEKDCG